MVAVMTVRWLWVVVVLVVVLAACGGDARFDAMVEHPMANPTVSGAPVNARSEVQGDSREPLFGARTASGVWTQFEVPFERFEEVRDELFAQAEELGYQMELISTESGLPRGTYIGRSDNPEYSNIGVEIAFSFDTITVSLF